MLLNLDALTHVELSMRSRTSIFGAVLFVLIGCTRGTSAPGGSDATPAVSGTCTDAYGTHRVGDSYTCECNNTCWCESNGGIRSTLMECLDASGRR